MSRLLALLAFLFSILCGTAAHAGEPEAEGSLLNDPGRRFTVRLHAELGFLSVFEHRLKLGTDGSDPDPFSDGFNANWLHFLTFSLGISVR